MRFAEWMSFKALRVVSASALFSGVLTASSAGALSPSIQYFKAEPVALSGSGRQVLLSNVPTNQTYRISPRASNVSFLWDLDDRDQTLLVEPDGTGLGFTFTDLSADGSTAVGSAPYLTRENTEFTAHRWRADSGFESLEAPIPDSGFPLTFWDLRASGDGTSVVGTSRTSDFPLSPTTTVTTRQWNAEGNLEDSIADPAGTVTRLIELSDDGTRFAGFQEQQIDEQVTTTAIRWTEAGGTEMILPETFAAFSSATVALSGDGRVAFGYYYRGSPLLTGVFVHDEENGFADLGALLPNTDAGSLFATNKDGSVAVGQVFNFGREENAFGFPGEAVLWNRIGGTRRLSEVLEGLGVDLKGEQLSSAIDISHDGTHILGHTNDGFAFVAIIPEPSPALLIGFGLAGLAGTSRRLGRERDAAKEAA